MVDYDVELNQLVFTYTTAEGVYHRDRMHSMSDGYGKEPAALTKAKRAIRNTPDTTFNYTALRGESKREVLEALLAEQGHLCAYCTCGIGIGDRLATIEHLFPHFCFVGLVLPECIP